MSPPKFSRFLSGLLILAASACTRDVDSAIVRRFSKPDASVVRVVTFPVEDASDLYVSRFDWQLDWWGSFVCFQFRHGRIEWITDVAEEPFEQSICSAKAVRLKGVDEPVIEVIALSHRGNGELRLYALENRRLTLLLRTSVIDFDGAETYRNGVLSIRYADLNGDGFDDVALVGILDYYSEKGEAVLSSIPVRRHFSWDSVSRRFRRICE
ncbi:MAG TPA: hypothetical protein VFC86_11630 [Planctomycetota bacterium]|nr:hypothetical protein [Planctomycetota bacterium]